VFHAVAVAAAAEAAGVALRRSQGLDEVPLTVDIDHTDLHTHIRHTVTDAVVCA